VVERVGGDRNLETQIGLQWQAEEMPRQHVGGAALARVGVGARECLADVLVGDHLAGGVDAGAAGVDGSGTLRVPGDAFVAHVLHAHRTPEMF
jgi:hypothetical protein